VSNVTDALSTPDPLSTKGPLQRPPVSGPGSGKDEWYPFAAQETGRTEDELRAQGLSRDQLVALVDHAPEVPEVREAPEGVTVVDEPKIEDYQGRAVWAVPVEGGYASEDEIRQAERELEEKRLADRHEAAREQLRQREA
jgi:hypothetical protein